ESIMPRLRFEEIWELIKAAQSDDAADIIQWLDDSMRDRVTERLTRDGDPHGLLPLLVFDEHSAGGRMKTEILRFHEECTVEEARRLIAADSDARRKSHYVYVVDKLDTLLGRFSLIKLLQAAADSRLNQMMNVDIAALPATMDQEDVALIFDEQSAIELPVVNHRQKLLGVITADDIFAVLEEEHGEDVTRLAGVHEDAHITDPIWLSARRRIPWLGINLITALIAAIVVSLFQATLQEMVILAAFMPVVAGLGGNAAQQALAVTIRAIALRELRHLRIMRVVAKEVTVGVMNGFLAGVIIGFLAALWTGDWAFGAVLVIALSINLLLAGFVGVAIPLVMRALKSDPALASTVFVTAATDICGFAIFLGLATVLL
ncbi:magnesium transporter, partial [Patescibacteria group bacterium]|nr:magnesium transporter [Patescibacteria group bacterium]